MPTKDTSVYKQVRVFKIDNSSAPDGNDSVGIYQMLTRKLIRTRSGSSLPNWRQRIADHQSATTALSAVWQSLSIKRGFIRLRCKKAVIPGTLPLHREIWGDIAGLSISLAPTHVPFASKAEARASAKFYSQVKEAQQKMSGPTFLGELRETMRMLRRPAEGLWKGVERYAQDLEKANRLNRRRYFKKDQPRYIRNLTQTAGELWLERAFGWLPLMHDIEDAKKAHNSLFEKERIVRLNAGGMDMKDLTYPSSSNGFSFGMFYNYQQVDFTTHTVRYRGAARAQAATTAQDRLARFGFTPSEFIPTAWELLPWSFLVDYFANIGDILSASTTDTSSVIWVSRSETLYTQRELKCYWDMSRISSGYDNYVITLLEGQPGSAIWSHKTVTRGGSGIPNIPSLYLTVPSNPWRLANVAALLAAVGLSTHPQKLSGRNYRL
jgi:hypothetical protein